MNNIVFILLSGIVFLTLDFIYLNIIKNYFKNQIKLVQGKNNTFNISGAILCYILLIFGLNYFILRTNKSIYDAFLFGIVIYGVYETTNYTLFHKWQFLTVIMDTLWGGFLFALTTLFMKKIKNFS
jgi:uncharacterized membrane protein